MSPLDYTNLFSPERQRKIVHFVNEEEVFDEPNEATETMAMREQMHRAFAMHALNQGHGVGLQNAYPPGLIFSRMKGPRPRTLILGHKAGLYLQDYSFESFCGLAKALALHEQQTFGYVNVRYEPKVEASGFYVEIEGDTRKGKNAYKATSSTFRAKYDTIILTLLKNQDPNKPRIRVRAQDDSDDRIPCAFDCDCDDSKELEVQALDVGFLRVLADWHRWEEEMKLLSNSQVFQTTLLDLLYPPEAYTYHYEFMMELPDGDQYRLIRGSEPLLSGEIQEALSRITTRQKQDGVRPSKVKLWPVNGTAIEKPQASPSQKSPGKASQFRVCERYTDPRYRIGKGRRCHLCPQACQVHTIYVRRSSDNGTILRLSQVAFVPEYSWRAAA